MSHALVAVEATLYPHIVSVALFCRCSPACSPCSHDCSPTLPLGVGTRKTLALTLKAFRGQLHGVSMLPPAPAGLCLWAMSSTAPVAAYPDGSEGVYLSVGVEVPFGELDWDVNLQHGQVRRLDERRLEERRRDVCQNFPKFPVHCLLVGKDETCMLPVSRFLPFLLRPSPSLIVLDFGRPAHRARHAGGAQPAPRRRCGGALPPRLPPRGDREHSDPEVHPGGAEAGCRVRAGPDSQRQRPEHQHPPLVDVHPGERARPVPRPEGAPRPVEGGREI